MLEFLDVWKAEKRADGGQPAWLLEGASFAIPQGRKVALLGASREVSATILHLMCGLGEPDRGAVRRVGVPCWPLDYSGYMDSKASIRQNATFLARVYGIDGGEVIRIAAKLSGVRVIQGKPYGHYALHDRRALLLGITLAIQFDWYFVNEKLPVAPAETAPAVDAALADRMERGGVIWAVSKPETVAGYCDAGLVLDRGTLTFYTSLDEAADAYRRSTESKAPPNDDRKPRETHKRRRAARRAGEIDPEKPV